MANQPTGVPYPILFIDHATQLGGAEHSLLLLLAHLDKSVWQPQLACPPGALAEAARQLGVPWHRASLPRLRRSWRVGLNWHNGAAELAQVARQIEARIVVANTVRAAFFAALASRLAKRPFLWHMRDFWLSETEPASRQVDSLLKKLLCRQATLVIANSQATAAHLPCANVQVVHNGLDLEQFSANLDGRPFRQAYKIPDDAPLIGTVGRLRPWKGQHRFIEMATAVSRTHPTPHFVIVGGVVFDQDNGYANLLHDLVQKNSLTHTVHFTGQIADVQSALAAMDIFVHAGDPEPFGLVNIEAMAMRKPIAAFRHGALPEIVTHGETGLLVPPTQTAELATAVSHLLTAPETATMMGAAGRQRVMDLFTIQKTAARFTELAQKILL